MRAHLVQLDIVWEDREANWRGVDALLAGTDIAEGDLVVLAEMFDSGFSLNIEQTADGDGRTLEYLRSLAKRLGVYVQGGRTVLEAGEDKATNRAPVIGPDGEVICEYAKIHPFSFGREGERFRGGEAIETYAWGMGEGAISVAPSICYDLRFPELFRLQMLRGAECLCLGANWPDARQHHWRALAIARAIENLAYMLCVNRTGSDPQLSYIGGSIAVGPRGEVLGELGDEEAVLSVEIEGGRVRRWREAFAAIDDIRLIQDDGHR